MSVQQLIRIARQLWEKWNIRRWYNTVIRSKWSAFRSAGSHQNRTPTDSSRSSSETRTAPCRLSPLSPFFSTSLHYRVPLLISLPILKILIFWEKRSWDFGSTNSKCKTFATFWLHLWTSFKFNSWIAFYKQFIECHHYRYYRFCNYNDLQLYYLIYL